MKGYFVRCIRHCVRSCPDYKTRIGFEPVIHNLGFRDPFAQMASRRKHLFHKFEQMSERQTLIGVSFELTGRELFKRFSCRRLPMARCPVNPKAFEPDKRMLRL